MNRDNVDLNVTFVVVEFVLDTTNTDKDNTQMGIYAYPNRVIAEYAVDKAFEPYRKAAAEGADIHLWYHPELDICHIWIQSDETSAAAYSFTFLDDPSTLLDIIFGN